MAADALAGSLRRQDISSRDIDNVEYVDPALTWGKILSTCVISMWSNDKKCKYMFMFPLQNLARKEWNSSGNGLASSRKEANMGTNDDQNWTPYWWLSARLQ